MVTGDYEITNYLKLMETGFGADYWIAPVLDYYRKYRRRGFVAFLLSLIHILLKRVIDPSVLNHSV